MPGVHDPLDPEYSILKQRLGRRLRYEKLEPKDLDLADITKIAERTISDVCVCMCVCVHVCVCVCVCVRVCVCVCVLVNR